MLKQNKRLQSLLLLHLIVLIFGFTGILGKFITLPAQQLVWFRMLIAFITIGLYAGISRQSFKNSPKNIWRMLAVGGIIAAHWITFFGSIKVSNVSIALACISSGALFTAFLEPWAYKRKIQWYEVFLGLVVIAALTLIFKFETNYQLGIILSVTSAFLASCFTVINGRFAQNIAPTQVSFYEMLGGWVCITIYLSFSNGFSTEMFQLTTSNTLSLLALGIVCTGFAFVAGVFVMKELTPFTVTLSVNLEPIYAIVMAFYFFEEHKQLSPEFFVGAVLILSTVLANATLKARKNKKALQTAN